MVTEALRQSHVDEKRDHDEAIARWHTEFSRLQTRNDAMYLDKLDGRIDAAFFDRRAAEWRLEQDQLLRLVEDHQAANTTYLEEGVRLLELVQRAHRTAWETTTPKLRSLEPRLESRSAYRCFPPTL